MIINVYMLHRGYSLLGVHRILTVDLHNKPSFKLGRTYATHNVLWPTYIHKLIPSFFRMLFRQVRVIEQSEKVFI